MLKKQGFNIIWFKITFNDSYINSILNITADEILIHWLVTQQKYRLRKCPFLYKPVYNIKSNSFICKLIYVSCIFMLIQTLKYWRKTFLSDYELSLKNPQTRWARLPS